jgi:hypothetical protein
MVQDMYLEVERDKEGFRYWNMPPPPHIMGRKTRYIFY